MSKFSRLLVLICFFLGIVCSFSYCQISIIENQDNIDVPPEVNKNINELVDELNLNQLYNTHNSKEEIKTFLLQSLYFEQYNFSYERLILTQSVNNYVYKVAKKVIPNFAKEGIKFFIMCDKEFNSYSTITKNIYINIGLLARIRSEDELAFIIAHEYSHILLGHGFERKEFIKKSLENASNLNINDLIRSMHNFSHKNEYEADSLATLLCLKKGINPLVIPQALENINYSTFTFSDIEYNSNYLFYDNFKIPDCFFLDSLKMNEIIDNASDSLSSHPNVMKRKLKVNSIIDAFKDSAKIFLAVVTNHDLEFEEIKDFARFEVVRQNILQKEYSNAIYHSFVLLKKYPNNEFLEISTAYALYAVSKFKIANRLFKVSDGYTRVGGQVQQVHYLVKQLTAKQFASISLKYIYYIQKKYPQNCGLKIILRHMVNELMKIVPKEEFLNNNFSDYFRLYNSDKLTYSTSELKAKYKDFYKYALIDEIGDSHFFKMIQTDSMLSTPYELTKNSNAERVKLFNTKQIKPSLSNYNILGPIILINYSKNIETELSNMYAVYNNIEFAELINVQNCNIENLNNYYDLMDLFFECANNDITNIYPYQLLTANLSPDILHVVLIEIQAHQNNYYYHLSIIDAARGNIFLVKTVKIGKTLNPAKIVKEINRDLNILSK